MRGRIAKFILLDACVILAVRLLTHVVSIISYAIIFALAVLILSMVS